MITTLALMLLAAACSNDNGLDEPIELDDNINEVKNMNWFGLMNLIKMEW